MEAPIVEPVDLFHPGLFDLVEGAQRATEERTAPTGGFGLEQPDRRLSQRIVVSVTDTADRCRNPFQHKSFRERDGCVLGGFN